MLLIERVMAALAGFLACDLFKLYSRDIERARAERFPPPTPPPATAEKRQVIVRFGR